MVRSLAFSLVGDYRSFGFNACRRVEHPLTAVFYCYQDSVLGTLLSTIRTANLYANFVGSNSVDLGQTMIQFTITSYKKLKLLNVGSRDVA